EEENYYFRLSEHKEWLLNFLRSHPTFVSPSFRQTELINAVEKLSGDLCISRPKSRLSWGVDLPFDRDYVNYVWFDALTNYISFIGYDPSRSTISDQSSTFRDKWPALHVIGKDIMVPAHGIYWPIMLHALGFPDEQMPTLLVHGWWNLGGAKMSKSTGNIIDPFVLVDKYGPQALRYYLMSVITGNDADFSEGFLVAEYNHDLANTLGNLVNRMLNMIHRFRNGTIESVGLRALAESEIRSHLQTWSDGELKAGQALYRDKFADFRPSNALSAPLARALACNALVEISAPWNLAKDKQQEELLDAVLYHLAESLRIIAIWISPVLPKAAHGIFDQLNWKMEAELSGKEERFSLADAEWDGLPDGHVVGKPVPLFPRIERGGDTVWSRQFSRLDGVSPYQFTTVEQ